METEEQVSELMADFLYDLAQKEYARMGDCFALGAIFKTSPQISLQRRKDTCSRAVAILKARNTIFEWSWRTEHEIRTVVVAVLKEATSSTQGELR